MHTHGNPDPCHQGIFIRDPFEKQFRLPACLVDISNGSGSKFKVVGEKNVMFTCINIPVTDTVKLIRTFLCCLDACKSDGLIAGQAFVLQNRLAIDHLALRVGFEACNKEHALFCQLVIPVIIEETNSSKLTVANSL